MKKIYQAPAIEVIVMNTQSLIAASIEIKNADATSEAMARDGGLFDDDED